MKRAASVEPNPDVNNTGRPQRNRRKPKKIRSSTDVEIRQALQLSLVDINQRKNIRNAVSDLRKELQNDQINGNTVVNNSTSTSLNQTVQELRALRKARKNPVQETPSDSRRVCNNGNIPLFHKIINLLIIMSNNLKFIFICTISEHRYPIQNPPASSTLSTFNQREQHHQSGSLVATETSASGNYVI